MWARIKYATVLFCVFLFGVSAGTCHKGSDGHGNKPMTLTIMHLNDTHSHLDSDELRLTLTGDDQVTSLNAGSFTRIATRIKQIRSERENTLLLHAGDAVQGTLYSVLYGGEADVDFLNLLEVNAMTAGNHEFDWDSETFADFINLAKFPVITANADFSMDIFLDGKIAPYIIRKFSGGRVGIIGLVTEDCPTTSSPDPAIVFKDPAQTAREYVSLLENMGVNKIILLTHLGHNMDMALARSVSGIDIIVGGHTHTLLGDFDRLGLTSAGDYPEVVTGDRGDTTLVVQAWKWADVLGRLDVNFDSQGRVIGWWGAPVIITGEPYRDTDGIELEGTMLDRVKNAIDDDPLVDAVEEDPQARALLDYYSQGLEPFQMEVVGQASQDLPHIRVPDETMPQGSMIAPIVCDGMLWKVRQAGMNVHVSIQNAGGVRADINAGDITVADVFTLHPFGNTLYVFSMTGAQLKQSLEDAIGTVVDNGSTGAFPYVAGLRYRAVAENPPGERVTAVDVGSETSGWDELDSNRSYTVVTNNYLAQGKDGYVTFGRVAFANGGYDTGFVDALAFIEYISAMETVDPVEQRVRFLSTTL